MQSDFERQKERKQQERRLKTLEQKIEQLKTQLQKLETEMWNASNAPHWELEKIAAAKDACQKSLEALETEWLELAESL